MTQKFHKGDLVHVAADLGRSMDHFTKDIDAIVIGSYKDKYGGGESNEKQYTLHLKGRGECSWYWEGQLELIEANRLDLLAQWDAEKKAEVKQASDPDWIFAQDYDEKKMPHGASIEVLARDLGCNNMWGSRGEGFVWHENALAVMSHAWPFLVAKNKQGWLDYAANIRSQSTSHSEPK